MRSIFSKPVVSLMLVLFLAGAAPQPGAGAEEAPLSYFQLQKLLMDFADRYMQMVGQAADALQKDNPNPDLRTAILSAKLFSSSAAFSIAADPSPHMALLNMEVLVRLQGSVWKETVPKRFGEKAAAPLLDVQKKLEEDIDAIALRALAPEKLEALKTLAEEWRKEHPDQHYVSYIRLSDFSDIRREGPRGKMPNLLSISGLLSAFQLVNMDDTTRSVDQARMVAERALYLSQRMPTLIRWQSEMLFYEMAATPETKNLMATTAALRNFPAEMRGLIREALKACLVLAFAIFILALLYRGISKKI
jgi:hypothetical protein